MNGDFLSLMNCMKESVVHGRFGLGTVVRMEGEGADAKAIINFTMLAKKIVTKIRQGQRSLSEDFKLLRLWNTIQTEPN